jgi:multidrug efflux pump subunit AcrA (membrane-fusion protein)
MNRSKWLKIASHLHNWTLPTKRRTSPSLFVLALLALGPRGLDAQPPTTSQPARIDPYERAPLYAKLQGYVQATRQSKDGSNLPLADIGDAVTEREILAEISVPELMEEVKHKGLLVEQARSEFEQAGALVTVAEKTAQATEARIAEVKASVLRTQGEWERWHAEYDRISALARTGSVTNRLAAETESQLRAADSGRNESQARVRASEADFARTQALIVKAKADQTVAQLQVRAAQADLNRVEVLSEYRSIRAPFAGIVTQRNVDTGHLVQPGSAESTPLFVVERIDRLRVVVEIPERESARVWKGNQAWISIPAVSTEELAATVSRTSWSLHPSSRTLRVEVDLPNEMLIIRPGMFAKARIELSENAPR